MPLYEYKCEEGHMTDVFFEIKHRKPSISCPICGKIAHRTFSTGGAFIKRIRVEDVWKAEGIEVGEGETIDRKNKNAKRIRKMRKKGHGKKR